MAIASAYRIDQVDVTQLEDADLEALARLRQALEHERSLEDPVTPLELVRRRLRNRPGTAIQRDWIVRSGKEVVATAQVVRWMMADNPHWRDVWIGVRADHRRKGLATELLREMVAAGADDPEIVMGSWVADRVPAGDAFARAIGATVGLATRSSELALADIDRALVAEWAAIDPAGYRLAWIDGDIPDELMDQVVVAYDTMNTAPMDDLQEGTWRTTPEMVRSWDRVRNANGGVRRLLLAIHEATGEGAGFTEVIRHPMTPWVIWQQGTAVVPAHRGHGIGKWVKAQMIERIFREWSDSKVVRTGNAFSNAPMLSINDRLGFKVTFTTNIFQVPLAEATRYVEARSA